MFYSLKSRTLLIASIMLLIVMSIALYGRSIFEDTILYGVENTKKQQELNQIIISMNYPLSAIEGNLYEYLLSLDDEDKEHIPSFIFELQAQLDNLHSNAIINETESFKKHAQRIDILIKRLLESYTALAKFTRLDRYPITKIINEKLNPTSNTFYSAIQILSDNQDELEIDMANVRHLIQELRYTVVQILSSTRLLFVTKTGIFGSNESTLSFVLKNQTEYQNYLNEIVLQFETYLNSHEDIDLEVEVAITDLIQANQIRNQVSSVILESLQSQRWREDYYLMETQIKPILDAIKNEFSLMERRLDRRAQENTLQTQEASNLLSNFLWVFAALIIMFFISIYLSIDKWFRSPLITISNAMNFKSGYAKDKPLKVIGLQEIDQVINAFNQMSKEITTRQQHLSYILQNVGEGIIVVDAKGQIDSFNLTAENIFKVNEKEIKNKNISEILDLHTIESDIQWLANIISEHEIEHLAYFIDGKRPNNDTFKCDVTVNHMLLNDDHYAIIVAKDATSRLANQRHLEQAKDTAEEASSRFKEQVVQLDQSMKELKETQDQLIESEKNASLSGLVAGVAHEINTPIGVSVTASSHLGEELKSLNQIIENNSITKTNLIEFIEDAKEASSIIDNNLKRAADLVKSFKMVAVDQTSNETREINLKEYMDEIILSLLPKLKKTQHQIDNNIDDSILITTSPGAISQVFTNFIINSLIHGFEHKKQGVITIESHVQDGTLTIVYNDDGKGMNEEHRKKIFDPFFTTKRGEGGSGLGMHIVHNLITQTLHGSIRCESSLDNGCLFEMKIPS